MRVKPGWTVFENSLTSAVIAFKEFCMEKRLFNIFKTTNETMLIQAILESSYTVLQVTSKWKTPKQSFHFLRVVQFWLYLRKNCKTTLFRMPTEISQMFGQKFIIFEKLRYRSQLLLKLQAIEIAIHSTEYLLDQLNNKHTKTAVN